MALNLFSDTLISFHGFLDFDVLDSLILPTYCLAHLAVTTAMRWPASPSPHGPPF